MPRSCRKVCQLNLLVEPSPYPRLLKLDCFGQMAKAAGQQNGVGMRAIRRGKRKLGWRVTAVMVAIPAQIG